MDLMFGAPVLEGGKKIGRLAGVEIDPGARRALKIVVSADGRLGPHAVSRPIAVILPLEGVDPGTIGELRAGGFHSNAA